MAGHELERIDKINTLPPCKTHGLRNTAYCQNCQKYLCPSCVAPGVHQAEHSVGTLANLYR